ncbi:hypothetical protein PENTCL1PPCAC_29089, partial [Pristionchus entomophagus]
DCRIIAESDYQDEEAKRRLIEAKHTKLEIKAERDAEAVVSYVLPDIAADADGDDEDDVQVLQHNSPQKNGDGAGPSTSAASADARHSSTPNRREIIGEDEYEIIE